MVLAGVISTCILEGVVTRPVRYRAHTHAQRSAFTCSMHSLYPPFKVHAILQDAYRHGLKVAAAQAIHQCGHWSVDLALDWRASQAARMRLQPVERETTRWSVAGPSRDSLPDAPHRHLNNTRLSQITRTQPRAVAALPKLICLTACLGASATEC